MKIFTIGILFVLSAFNSLLAQQPELPLDFESTSISYTFTNFGGGVATKIANPQINGINTSATVAKMIKNAGDVFGGSFITMASPVNFATNKIFKIKVFSPLAGKKLLLKFEGAGATFEKESIGVTTANVWQELTFDFTGVTGLNNLNTKIVFIFDLGTQGDGSANSTYLFDDVVQTSNFVGGVTGDYNLVWSDEFVGTGAPANDHWFRQTQLPVGGSWYSGEQQHYTNRNENSFIANGNLNIVAKKESFTDQGQTKQYTSARLNSKYAFMYGRVDVRAKVGGGAGTLPAIWMLGKNIDEPGGYFAGEFGTTVWPATGEMDIMEHWGNNPNVIHQSIHTPSSFGGTVNTNTTTISQVSTTFHVYSLIWDANQIQFLIDDVAYYTYNPTIKDASTWPFDKPLYLLLNIALGGGGDPIDPAFTQSTLEVDYVRVYQKGGTPAPPPAEPTAAATTPTRPSTNVISMFSNAYTNVPVNTWRADWSVAKLTDTQVLGNDVKKYNRLEVVGIETTGANLINASSMLYFHLDAWTPNMTTFRIKLVDFGANGVYSGGDDKEAELSFTPTLNGWNSYEIPLTNFTTLTSKSHIAQLVLSGIPVGTSTVFIDNVYFHNVSSQQITFPVIADKTLGGLSFSLGATSSSGLAVTYTTASNEITIAGSQVTMVSAGRASIIANQAGNASFNPASPVERSFCINPVKPLITIEAKNTESVTLASSSATGNQWFLNGTLMPNETSSTLTSSVEGAYTVQVKVDGCESEISEETLLIITGGENSMVETKMVYPNPTENYVEIKGLQNKKIQTQILDLMGRTNSIVFEEYEGGHRANVQNLARGIYFIQIVDGSKMYQVKVIIK